MNFTLDFSSADLQPLAQQEATARLDQVLEDWAGSGRIVGAVVLIARDGCVFARAAGFADREVGIPVRLDTIFRHASMTKLITSIAALALVDAGRLDLDRPVSKYLPFFTPNLPDGRIPVITPRQLMTHTAGLSYAFFEPPGNPCEVLRTPLGLGHECMSLMEAARHVAAAPLFYEPGTEWRYSIGIDVLGAVIEAASGQPLPALVERLVTAPLGMADTHFVVRDPQRLAAHYRDGKDLPVRMAGEADRIPLGEHGVEIWPDRFLSEAAYPSGGAGMSGTARDYLALLEAVRTGGGPVLSEKSAQLIGCHAIGELRAWTEGEGWGHGLGAAVLLDSEAARTPQNAGTFQWAGALGSHWFIDLTAQLSVVVLTNTSVAGMAGPFAEALRDAIYADLV